jgi:site-specific recombinase XerD
MSKVIQVRGVPDDVHERLVQQARDAGTSLNQYVLRELKTAAGRSKNAEIFLRAARRPGPRLTRKEIVRTIREDRDSDHSL